MTQFLASFLSLLSLPLFAATITSQKLAPPAVGAYHSAYMDFGGTAEEVSEDKIRIYEQTAGKRAVWAYFANDWLEGKITFPTASVRIIRDHGLIPYLRLMPWSEMVDAARKSDPHLNMQSFLEGKHDAALRAYFTIAKTQGPLMMEFGPEVNGKWFPWNGTWNGGSTRNHYGDPQIPDGPERFRDVFRRIIRIARATGANNITWVFHIDSARDPESEWNDAKYYFPGDDYIDWIGISVFGAQLPTHEWELFPSKLKRFLPQLENLHSQKPWLIAEMAVIEDPNGDPHRKANWIHQALQSVENGTFSKIKGISYWHSPGWLQNGKADFKVDSSPQSLEAYRSEIQKSFWVSLPNMIQTTSEEP